MKVCTKIIFAGRILAALFLAIFSYAGVSFTSLIGLNQTRSPVDSRDSLNRCSSTGAEYVIVPVADKLFSARSDLIETFIWRMF